MDFNSSPRSTLGVEVEYWAVDNDSGLPVACSVEVLGEMGRGHPGNEHPKAKHELFESSIEVITGICETPAEARADLEGTIAELRPLLAARNVKLMSSGTHPFAEWTDLIVSPNPRYHQLVEDIQWPARRLMIHGVHVHVGVRSGEKAIQTVNGLTTYLPHLLALSCSSPYWESENTGLASARTKVFEVMPTAGLPPQLTGWGEFERFLDALIRRPQHPGQFGGVPPSPGAGADCRPAARTQPGHDTGSGPAAGDRARRQTETRRPRIKETTSNTSAM